MSNEEVNAQLVSDANDWKLKYLDTLQAIERKEAQWTTLDRLLRNTTSRMALALQGMHPDLDPRLEQLRAALRNHGDDQALDQLSRAITESLDRLEAQPANFETSPGLFGRLWGRRHAAPSEPAPAGAADAAARAAFSHVLDQLALTAEDGPLRDDLKRQLSESRPDWNALSDSLVQLVDRACLHLQRQKHDIEEYLLQLSQRLQGFDELVQSIESNRVDADQETRQLDQSFRAQVRDIHSNVDGAADLGQLKNLVQNRLDSLDGYVRAYLESCHSRSREAQARIEDLSGKLVSLEAEAHSLRNRLQQQRQAAQIDGLTGIYNRQAYEERVGQEFARWRRFGTPVSMAVLDIDNFKVINDTYGHQAGDKVLTTIASVLSGNIRETDFLARYGGEEFVLMMPGADLAAGLRVTEKLRVAVQDCGFHYRGQAVPITVSCGITDFHGPDTDSSAAAFARADRAMYRAKQAGRNRCEVAED